MGLDEIGTKSAKEIIERRILDRNSVPGFRKDGARLALLTLGGGMAGAVSAAFVSRMELHGLLRVFDVLVGVSAGCLVNTYFLSGQAVVGAHMIPTWLSNKGYDNDGMSRKYVDWRRLFTRDVVWDLAMCIDGLMGARVKVGDRVSSIPSYSIASDRRGRPWTLRLDNVSGVEARRLIAMSCRMPLIMEKDLAAPLAVAADLWDGGLARSPIERGLSELGVSHVFVLNNFGKNERGSFLGFLGYVLTLFFASPRLAVTALVSRAHAGRSLEVMGFKPFEIRPARSIGTFETCQNRIWRVMVSAFYQIGALLELPEIELPDLWTEQMKRDGIDLSD